MIRVIVVLCFASVCIGLANGALTVTPSNTAVVAGSWMAMECRTTNGSTVYRWTLTRPTSSRKEFLFTKDNGGQRLSSNHAYGVDVDEHGSGLLYLNATQLDDAGLYTCYAFANNAQLLRSAQLIVLESEPFCETNYTVEDNATLIEGDIIWMQCTVNFRGMWAPSVEWKQHTENDKREEDDQQTVLQGVSTVTEFNNRVTSTLINVIRSSKTTYFSCRMFFQWHNGSVQTTATNLPTYTYTWKSPRCTTTPKPSGSNLWSERGFIKDACVWESLEANCSGNKVLLIEKASFGRLRSGRCFNLARDEKPCYADVQSFVERHCSGRRYCQIRLTNENLKLFPSNCSIYSQKSLEIKYKCIDVYSSENKPCALNQSLLVTTSSGYLANIVTDETGQGSQLCPWRFEPGPGQTVHLTLLDFGVWIDRANRDRRNTCRIYAAIKQMGEAHQRMDTVVCGGMEREKVIMSTDEEIMIAVVKQENTDHDTAYFFIKYQVLNCPKFDMPAGSVADISGYGIAISCQFNRDLSWEVKCISGEWTPKHNITCLATPTFVSLPTADPEKQQTTEAEQLCSEIFPSNGASIEMTTKGYRVSCPDGDSVELHCIDGAWVPSQPSKCLAYIIYPGQDAIAERSSTKDACVWEKFQARCSENRVLLIEKASFGRLRSGRCFNLTMDEKPCYADVQSFVERHCSGRRYCQIRLTNENLKLFPSNCSLYSQKSLEIEYKCIEVHLSDDQSCISNKSLTVTRSSGYLANIVTDETGHGSQLCPWRFQPQKGQTVHLTLLDFGVWIDRAERDRRNICRIYAIIKEMGEEHQTKDTLVCGGVEREKFVMSTDTEITIAVIKQENTVNDTASFFIKYQVFNCSKLDVPVGAITDISANGIRIYCPLKRDVVWEVRCIAGEWTPKHNISCINRTSVTPIPTDFNGSRQPTESSLSCPKLYSTDGVSIELTNSGYRASCSDGDSVELFCIDGTWVPSQPSRCIVFSTKAVPGQASDPMKIAAIALPAVALIALVVTVTFTCIICRRR